MSAVEVETPPPAQTSGSTYQWLASNPIASSCGTTIYSAYEGSKNYSRLTKAAFGTVESAVVYVTDTARPVVGKVAEKLDHPITVVDETIAGGLEKLEERYPVMKKQPSVIASEGKQLLCETLQAGQQRIGNTRLGSFVGCGVDCTLSATEAVVNKILPPSDTEDSGEEEESEKVEEEAAGTSEAKMESSPTTGVRRRWWKRKKQSEAASPPVTSETETETEVVSGDGDVTAVSRMGRVQKLSYAVYYRTLQRLQAVQEQVQASLKQLKISIGLLKYAQMVSSKVDGQRQNVQQALKDAETRIRQFLTCQAKPDPSEDFACWIAQEKSDDKDIQWLLDSSPEKKKDLFQRSLDCAKQLSEQVYNALRSVSGITAYLPARLRQGSDHALQQAKDVYTTLKLNNVPSELPSFLLSQVTEVVDTQIGYCRQLGQYLSSALKKRFGSGEEDDGSSQTDSELADDEEEHDEENDKDDDEESDDEEEESEGAQEPL